MAELIYKHDNGVCVGATCISYYNDKDFALQVGEELQQYIEDSEGEDPIECTEQYRKELAEMEALYKDFNPLDEKTCKAFWEYAFNSGVFNDGWGKVISYTKDKVELSFDY